MESILISDKILGMPAIHIIAEKTATNTNTAIGLAVKWFAWVEFEDKHERGEVELLTRSIVDDIVGTSGFAEALESIGWIEFTNTGVKIHENQCHLRGDLRKRTLTSRRQRKHRGENE